MFHKYDSGILHGVLCAFLVAFVAFFSGHNEHNGPQRTRKELEVVWKNYRTMKCAMLRFRSAQAAQAVIVVQMLVTKLSFLYQLKPDTRNA
jgi:hypothetical protein